ncbi:MAG: hypothetical protein AAFP90_12745 [Planctomycetota bacterium]
MASDSMNHAMQPDDASAPRRWSLARHVYAWGGHTLMLGFLVCAFLWSIHGGSAAGSVSWRKPILFCIASGLLCYSMAWVADLLRPSRWERLWAVLFTVGINAEVFLIAMQQFRGVPSHFNRSTVFDTSVLFGIKACILLATLVILLQTVRLFVPSQSNRYRSDLPSDSYSAARWGMVLMLIACCLGFWIESLGEHAIGAGKDPTRYGERGVLKFPHGMPLHAIQFLPIAAWLLGWFGVPRRGRSISVHAIAWGIVGITIFALMQTFSGRARCEVTLWTAPILATSIAAMMVPLVILVWQGCWFNHFGNPKRQRGKP